MAAVVGPPAQPASIVWTIDNESDPVCLSIFPMNSCCIFKQSELNYRQLNEKDDYLFR